MKQITVQYMDPHGYTKAHYEFSIPGIISVALMDAAFWISIGYILGTRL